MRTYWHCEECDRVHYVDHLSDTGVVEVVNRIRINHHKLKPKCQNTVDRIRIIAIVNAEPEAIQ